MTSRSGPPRGLRRSGLVWRQQRSGLFWVTDLWVGVWVYKEELNDDSPTLRLTNTNHHRRVVRYIKVEGDM